VSGKGEPGTGDAARKRVAIEMIAKHERTLRRTARRYSICAADADDAYQRALEILLVKAPPGEARELIRWMQTVTKHEALAIRRSRERQLSPPGPPGADEEAADWLSLLPGGGAGPAERAERREDIARSREALKTLKPAELKALTLLAEGYSYAEIGEMTGFSRTKVNRCLAEGRERFRAFLSRSESGARCEELRPVLSAFCDGEAKAEEAAVLREHLRVCGYCRAAMRAYRAAPRAVVVLAPAPVLTGSLVERLHDALAGLRARLPERVGGLGEASTAQVATGGGAGTAALGKALAVCAATVGGAACVATGVVPPPAGLAASESVPAGEPLRPRLERSQGERRDLEEVVTAPPARRSSRPSPPAPGPEPPEPQPVAAAEAAPEPVEAEAVEYAPPPAPPPPSVEATEASAASPAGEFGP
jgi:RNA polymerase sigma factor (sigma-70 family)